MALSKEKKSQVVEDVSQLIAGSKLTVLAKYQGTSVQAMQQLRRDARENGTQVKVFKNRLFKKALEADDRFKGLETSLLTGQLLYAFNGEDEVAPAQALAEFAKSEPQIEFVGGINSEGQWLTSDDIKMLASLPSKDQLRAQLVAIVAAPISSVVGIMNSNLRALLNVLNAKAEISN